ncbi:3-hydroxybutyryl-CoA dehydrogenase [Algoriphagus boseongensis]|uniref:3-hydroxybutyryl-CoA dehydrogenase n=1 Tax=Algoriphagus boseongensis TaxID=1442587 RepID=A0A4R6T9E2_9BACT|nr:3-hydroxyacyl-CoA dehydrogenase [Algoriphagus boseongensis]TDQ18803.1 3-hydroxybutyryl-CoA dehydrogenase [Algoriphagus boseongensis]
MEIKKICILGAGTLGSRVALQAAISGFEVKVYDITQKALDFSLNTMQKILHLLVKSGQLNKEDLASILARIEFTLDPKVAVADADFINESVTEEPEIKKKVWKQFGELAPEKTWFTTNTSYLLPSMFAEESGRPAKFCAFHFHDVFYSRVVDIMPHPGTDPSMIPMLEDLGRKLNQVPVLVKKENPGYIFNTMLMALIGAAGKLLTKEVGSIEDIDRSWMVNFHMPMGPFGILDSIGLDTAWHVTHNLPDAASKAFAAHLKTYLDQGKLGEKTGEGFYSYPNPAYKNPDFIK